MAEKKTRKKLTKEEAARLRDIAKALYIHEDITSQKVLAERVGVSTNTMCAWFKEAEHEWQRLKKNLILTREERMSDLYDELTEIANAIKQLPEGERFATHKLALVRRMVVKDIADLQVEAAIPDIVAALSGLVKFVRNENLDEAKTIIRWADIYLKTLLK